MSAQPLFATRAVRVLDRPSDQAGAVEIGHVFVEPAPGDPSGQVQYWILSKLLGSAEGQTPTYALERWADGPASRAEWLAAVTSLWPKGGGYYVVARSAVAMPTQKKEGGFVFDLTAPPHPRREVVARLLAESAAGSGAGGIAPGPGEITGPTKPAGQVIVPLAEMLQSTMQDIYKSVGVCGGWVEEHEELTYFTGEELFLLEQGYVSAGEGIVRTRIAVKEDLEMNTFGELRAHIEEKWTEGCRYEVTACAYYKGEGPPPPEFR